MGRNKKDLNAIKDALLSRTSYIKNDVEEHLPPPAPVKENSVEIETLVYSQFKVLAAYYDKNTSVLINEALAHYLRLKKLDIDEATKKASSKNE